MTLLRSAATELRRAYFALAKSHLACRGKVWLAIRSRRACEGAKYGQEWIRTTEGVKPADLQSAPFGHFGTYPEQSSRFTVARSRFTVGKASHGKVVITRSSLYRTLGPGVQADFGTNPITIVGFLWVAKKYESSRGKFHTETSRQSFASSC
jgi:hypothetical protein